VEQKKGTLYANIQKGCHFDSGDSLLACGVVAGGGGSASAATGQSLNGCSATYGVVLGLAVLPTCTAGDSTIANPTSITITLNTSSLGSILSLLGLGVKATWTLSCTVDGNRVTSHGGYQITTLSQSASDVIDLQSAVGSPNPSSCTVTNLTATSLASVTALTLNLITIGANATADTGVPGAVHANYPSDSDGAHAVVCDEQRRRRRLPHRPVVGDDRRRTAAHGRLPWQRRPAVDRPERHRCLRRDG
jgi:hypothetical protein